MHRLSSVIAAFVIIASSALAGVSVESPLRSRGGLSWVEVRAGGSARPLNFIVDTGAASTVLDLSAAGRLGVKLGRVEVVQGVRSRQNARRVDSFDGTVAGLPLPRSVLVLDLKAASRAIGFRIDGLVGADFFRGRIVQLDGPEKILRVLSACPTTIAGEVLPARMINSTFCVPVRVNDGVPQWMRLDTGCSEALQWVSAGAGSTNAVRAASIGLSSAKAVSGRVQVRLGSGAEYAVRAVLHSREIFAGEAGLLGSKLLSRFCVTIDGVSRRVILDPL